MRGHQMAWADDRPVGVQTGERSAFLVRTYGHLFGAIGLFTLIEIYLFRTELAFPIAEALLGVNWLLVLGGFILVSWIASRVAHTVANPVAQYVVLVLFVAAEAVIFVPLLVIAEINAPGAIASAAVVTLLGFTGLTAVAVMTRKDFSFLGGLLRWGGIIALLAIVSGVIFGFALGTWFSVAMVGLAGAAVLYDTSKILRDFPTDRHVGAALELFASVALMFWYILRIFIASRD